MDYTEQFIRLNCSLMSDYKMMKLNADMKCMGLGLYLETILFLRKQQEYKHDFNELDLLADQWGATVENLQHLIKDFDLFLITEDGYFRCLYLDEVMGYQSKLSEQRAAAGSKGGRSSKKSTVKASAKATASTASAIGRGRINEGKNGDTSCVDNNGEAYMKSDDTPCVYDNGEAYLKSDDTPCMDNNGEVYMKSGDAFCVDNNGEAYMESSGVPCMDNNKEVYLKSSVPCATIYMFLFVMQSFRRDKEQNLGQQLKSLMTPLNISTLAMLIMLATGWKFSGAPLQFLSSMANCVVPTSMLIIGCLLAGSPLIDVLKKPILYLITFLRCLVMPLIAAVILRFTGWDRTVCLCIVMVLGCSVATVISIFGVRYDRSPEMASKSVLQSNLLLPITMPLMMFIAERIL